ncbi:MAG: type II secretion system F family protein [Clostridiales bacterium]|jgi:type IV pilus assembly protein PilC|nr:type II secretion system F family protein [Clostridiales bacterium]
MKFKYKAVDKVGQIMHGGIEALSETEAINLIQGKSLRLIQLDLDEDTPKDITISFLEPKVKTADLTVFCKQLSTMLNAGIPVSRALDILASQTTNKTMKQALTQVSSHIKQGMTLSKAMRRFRKIFPPLLLNMVESGELTGKLDEVLARMQVHYEKENRINSKIKGAMIYPIVLTTLTVAVMIVMLTFVMPMFADIFSASTLPLPTRIMLGASDILRNYWYIIIAAVAAFVYGFKMFKKSKEGRRIYDNALLTLPIIGKLMSTIITARFTRTLSTLLSSGVSIIKALESATEITNNVIVMKDMSGVINNVKKGVALSALLKRVQTFPPMMVSMLSIGEETGAIDDMLSKTADFYDDELEVALSKLVALLEPLMIVVMGVGIGGIVIAMYLPMFDMFNNIQM